MIPVSKEPRSMFEMFRVYEKCVFCKTQTEYWFGKGQHPVCKECAKTKTLKDLKKATTKTDKDGN